MYNSSGKGRKNKSMANLYDNTIATSPAFPAKLEKTPRMYQHYRMLEFYTK